MKGPEDDAGLAGKVALISGGGAAGDGIGNGRAAAILLARDGVKVLVADRDLALAQRTVEMIKAEGGIGGSDRLRRHPGSRVQEAGRCRGRALGPARFPRQQCRHRQPRQRGRREAGGIPPGDAGQCRDHVPALEIRHPRHDQDRQRRRDRQHLLDLGAAAARADHLYGFQGRGDRIDPGDGGRSRPRQYPRQLHLPRPDVHADGLCPTA